MEDKNVEAIKEAIKQVVAKNGTHLSEKDLKKQEDVLIKIHVEGKKPYEAMNIPKEMIEYLYMNAFNLYNSSKYEEARKIFYILEIFDPKDSRFSYGIAACHHMEKKYPLAIHNYMKCLYLPPVNPMTYYHLADCYLKSDRKREAAVMLKTCIRNAGEDANYGPMKSRAEQELNSLMDEFRAEAMKEDEVSSNASKDA